ncbi:sec1 family domain-containing protein 2-like isoform X1 [Hylaeus volcanicus]|uniref:sec1 family domain-containing protein 2-like isoform X1 n=2 Tax=Hylaeus volcanicus TaxID=313075 RepID=UPI0023B8472E|nr:sec1 family domain-containing protein 2-like isoform X1 [Hylaeus volcanicus]
MTDILYETRKFISDCWANIFAEVCGTVVYIDNCAAECLHWYTAGKGYLALKDAGAIAVHELGMYHFRYVEVKDTKKAVIVSTADDPAFYQRTIKMILAKNVFESCTIYCSAPCSTTDSPQIIHLPTEEKLNYNELKRDIKAWMSSKNLSQEPSVNIVHVPMFIALLDKNLFVTPPFGDLMPPLDTTFTKDTFSKLNFLANSFYKFFNSINAKLDIYALGKLSNLLAENLANYIASTDRRNVSSEMHSSASQDIGLSLILMDRTLDLCTPTSNNMESFLTKILRTFPRLPQHNNDVSISMSPIVGPVEGSLRACEVPGCLASIDKSTIHLFISEKEKKLLTVANESLNDIVSTQDNPKLRTPTRISGHRLEKAVNKLRTTNSIDSIMAYKERLQSILAIVEASTSQKAGQLELLTSLEKLVLQNLSVSRESSSILAQLSDVIQTRIDRGLDTENLLALLIHVYALAGTQIRFSTQQERQLEESIADAIFEDLKIFKENPSANTTSTYQRTLLLLGVNDVVAARETSYRIASRIIGILQLVAQQRSTLQDYRFCMIKPNAQEAIRRVSILEQITRDILCASAGRELYNLRKRSSPFLLGGFNFLLRGKEEAKLHPHDNPYILIYVIGGITAEEAKVIHEMTLSQNNDKMPYIMLAGSRLLNPLDIVDNILFQ